MKIEISHDAIPSHREYVTVIETISHKFLKFKNILRALVRKQMTQQLATKESRRQQTQRRKDSKTKTTQMLKKRPIIKKLKTMIKMRKMIE